MLKNAKKKKKIPFNVAHVHEAERGEHGAHVWVWKTQVRVWTFVPSRIVEWISVADRRVWA